MSGVEGTSCLRCSAPAKLQCPKCIELNLPRATYCSQECFKAGWGAVARMAAAVGRLQAVVHSTRREAPPCMDAHGLRCIVVTMPPPSPPLPLAPVQAAWGEHKAVHKTANGSAGSDEGWAFCTKRGKGRQSTMPLFPWTGGLRPHKISPRREVRRWRRWCWPLPCMPESTSRPARLPPTCLLSRQRACSAQPTPPPPPSPLGADAGAGPHPQA
jgi:hypothetical protein